MKLLILSCVLIVVYLTNSGSCTPHVLSEGDFREGVLPHIRTEREVQSDDDSASDSDDEGETQYEKNRKALNKLKKRIEQMQEMLKKKLADAVKEATTVTNKLETGDKKPKLSNELENTDENPKRKRRHVEGVHESIGEDTESERKSPSMQLYEIIVNMRKLAEKARNLGEKIVAKREAKKASRESQI